MVSALPTAQLAASLRSNSVKQSLHSAPSTPNDRYMKPSLSLLLLASFLMIGCGAETSTPTPETEAATVPEPAAATGIDNPTLREIVAAGERTVQDGFDPYGFYMPMEKLASGPVVFDLMSMGSGWEFTDERGLERPPFRISLNDTTSATAENELGQEYHEVSYMARASAFRITSSEIYFSGEAQGLGIVEFAGRFEPGFKALQESAGAPSYGEAAVTGTLFFGGKVFSDVGLIYFAGD